jgi:hypothetical protein
MRGETLNSLPNQTMAQPTTGQGPANSVIGPDQGGQGMFVSHVTSDLAAPPSDGGGGPPQGEDGVFAAQLDNSTAQGEFDHLLQDESENIWDSSAEAQSGQAHEWF